VGKVQPAVHRAILIVDVENFGDPARTNADQLAVRDEMYKALRRSLAKARIRWADCEIEDRGDGILVLVPPELPKGWLVTRLPTYLAATLARHNAACPAPEQIRLRMALHAGEVHRDAQGFTGASINRAFRLIEAPAARAALHDSPGVMALIVSDWFYDEVVQHYPAAEPPCFRQVHVVIKETDTTAWVRVLKAPERFLPPGTTMPLGARITEDHEGTSFAIFSRDATRVELCLVDEDGNEQRRIDLSKRGSTKDVWCGHVRGAVAGQRYGYRVSGKYNPVSGHRFNPNKLLLDPYAKAITRTVKWSSSVFGYDPDHGDLVPDESDSARYVPLSVIVDDRFDRGNDRRRKVPWVDTVIYEVHVRGFTKQYPGIPDRKRGTYAAMGSASALKYLKDLGITTLQLMPVNHFVSEQGVVQRGLTNYWGYNPIGYFAPEARYSSSGTAGEQVREFKEMIRNLHDKKFEVILNVVFGHTAEGGQKGPHLCFRGIDNRAYYQLADDPRGYKNSSGCGNSFNMSEPRVLNLIKDSLRYWVEEMHVDGFHFDAADSLATDLFEAGCLDTFFDEICKDEVISKVKLIAESWDLGDGGYQVRNFPGEWGEFNDSYRDAVCRFWRGAAQPAEELARRLTGSDNLCKSDGSGPAASINFITYHDGFTLDDLVSYNEKHNEANGHNNEDGIGRNESWNCGAEGETDDPQVRKLRERLKRNLLTTLFLSAGVPILQAGDELGRTQNGNNNPYCHDSEISWVNWDLDERGKEFLQWTKELIAIRAKHPIFRRRKPFQGQEIRNTGMKDIGWFTPDATEMTEPKWREQDIHALGMFLNGQATFERTMHGERKEGESFLLLFNGGHDKTRFKLPGLPWAASYVRILDTYIPFIYAGNFQADATDIPGPHAWKAGDDIEMEAWSMVVLGITGR
jgi:isoamylase